MGKLFFLIFTVVSRVIIYLVLKHMEILISFLLILMNISTERGKLSWISL